MALPRAACLGEGQIGMESWAQAGRVGTGVGGWSLPTEWAGQGTVRLPLCNHSQEATKRRAAGLGWAGDFNEDRALGHWDELSTASPHEPWVCLWSVPVLP